MELEYAECFKEKKKSETNPMSAFCFITSRSVLFMHVDVSYHIPSHNDSADEDQVLDQVIWLNGGSSRGD